MTTLRIFNDRKANKQFKGKYVYAFLELCGQPQFCFWVYVMFCLIHSLDGDVRKSQPLMDHGRIGGPTQDKESRLQRSKFGQESNEEVCSPFYCPFLAHLIT